RVHARVDRRPRQVHPEGLSEGRHAQVVRVSPGGRSDSTRRLPDEAAGLNLPHDFPRKLGAVACDLDRTLIGEDGVLRARTKAVIAATRAAGIHVVLVTGRMFQSIRPYALE